MCHMLPGPPAPHELPAVRSRAAFSSPFLTPPMRFHSTHTQLRNRLASTTTRENSSSDHLCEIVPVKRPSLPESEPAQGGRVDGWGDLLSAIMGFAEPTDPLLAESHLTRRLFASKLGRIAVLFLPAG